MAKTKELRCNNDGRHTTFSTHSDLSQESQQGAIQPRPVIPGHHDHTDHTAVSSSKSISVTIAPTIPSLPIPIQVSQPLHSTPTTAPRDTITPPRDISITHQTTPQSTLAFLAPSNLTPTHPMSGQSRDLGISTILRHHNSDSDSEDQNFRDPYAFCDDVVLKTPLSGRNTIKALPPPNRQPTQTNLDVNKFYTSHPKKPCLRSILSPKLARQEG